MLPASAAFLPRHGLCGGFSGFARMRRVRAAVEAVEAEKFKVWNEARWRVRDMRLEAIRGAKSTGPA
jgi:hypothetical protein